MSHQLVEQFADYLIHNSIIKTEDRDIYTFGLYEGLFIILNLITSFIIAIYADMLWESIVFFVSYIPLRSYAGGYHAKTHLRCYFFSTLVLIVALYIIENVFVSIVLIGIVLIFSVFIIGFLSPVEDANKPLDNLEINVYKKRAIAILVLELLLAIGMYYFGFIQTFLSIFVSIFILSVVVVLGIVKNRIHS